MAFRAKAYGNKHAEVKGDAKVPNKVQVSGDIADFKLLVKGDTETVEAFNETVSAALPKSK